MMYAKLARSMHYLLETTCDDLCKISLSDAFSGRKPLLTMCTILQNRCIFFKKPHVMMYAKLAPVPHFLGENTCNDVCKIGLFDAFSV